MRTMIPTLSIAHPPVSTQPLVLHMYILSHTELDTYNYKV